MKHATKVHPEGVQITVRLPPDLAAALGREVERLRAERPGERVSTADVVRRIFARALGGQGK